MNRREFQLKCLYALVGVPVGASVLVGKEPNHCDWQCKNLEQSHALNSEQLSVVTSLAVQPRGRLLAAGGDRHMIQIREIESGQVVHRLTGHTDWVRALEFSPDGNELFSAGNDRIIIRWDPVKGEKIEQFATCGAAIADMGIDPLGQMLSTVGFESHLHTWSLEEKQPVSEIDCPCRDMRSIDFSNDGRLLAFAGRSGVVRVWDRIKGAVLRDMHLHQRTIHQVLFTPDSRSIVTCSDDGKIKLTSIDGTGLSGEFPEQGGKVMSIQFISPNRLASAGADALISIWDTGSFAKIGELSGHRGTVTTMVSNATFLVSTGFDTQIRRWQHGPSFASSDVPQERIHESKVESLETSAAPEPVSAAQGGAEVLPQPPAGIELSQKAPKSQELPVSPKVRTAPQQPRATKPLTKPLTKPPATTSPVVPPSGFKPPSRLGAPSNGQAPKLAPPSPLHKSPQGGLPKLAPPRGLVPSKIVPRSGGAFRPLK